LILPEILAVKLTSEQANAITSAVWLVGIGILITTGYWWPGLLFLLGAGSIAQGFVEGRGWYSIQCGLWAIGLGFVFVFKFTLLGLFILVAIGWLFTAFAKPSPFEKKPEPDQTLVDDGF
jgi:hypothetical protein